MELVMNQLDALRWIFSLYGLTSLAAIVALLLSGVPGAILPNMESTALGKRASSDSVTR